MSPSSGPSSRRPSPSLFPASSRPSTGTSGSGTSGSSRPAWRRSCSTTSGRGRRPAAARRSSTWASVGPPCSPSRRASHTATGCSARRRRRSSITPPSTTIPRTPMRSASPSTILASASTGERRTGRPLMPPYSTITVPPGDRIQACPDGRLDVPSHPILPFIEGDGTGPDIWRASQAVFDAAVDKAYGGKRRIAWMEVYAGEKAFNRFKDWLPEDTVNAFKEFVVGIKGPLTTPIGGGIRSLNVTLRQVLDLYVCLRPVRWFKGVPSPVKHPEKVDMVIFRENTEDIYAGIEWAAGTEDAQKMLDFLRTEFPKEYGKIRFPDTTGIGIKPVSKEGT